jgi:single-strand DNA-binding protein
MPALNRVQLIGHLGKDPETRFTSSGKKVSHFTLAVNRRGGSEPDWFNVEAWERLAEVCQQYLSKGRLVMIEGRLQTDRWTDDQGAAHQRALVVARQLQMLDRKPDEPESADGPDEAE